MRIQRTVNIVVKKWSSGASSIKWAFAQMGVWIGLIFTTKKTGWSEMKDLITLFDSICEAYDRPDFIPKNGITYCNQAVDMVAGAMGCHDFEMKNANEIVEFMVSDSNWQEIKMNQAQDMANEGSLCVAGIDSATLKQEHGHVVVIRPGKQVYSGKWGLTPRCLNIGEENFLARAKKGPLTAMSCGLNEAFQPLPQIWVWRPSL